MNTDKRIEGPVYVTSHALTRGIVVYEGGGVVASDKYFQGGNARQSCSDPAYCFVNDTQWTTDWTVALTRWQEAKQKKMLSLQRQLRALSNLEPKKVVIPKRDAT